MKSPSGTPIIREMQVIPVAGYDSMLLNLCGAHAPYFTRTIVILEDSLGNTGLGEVPGGEGIRQTLDRQFRSSSGSPSACTTTSLTRCVRAC